MNEKPMSIWISLGKELSHRQKKLAIAMFVYLSIFNLFVEN
jgi:hypothetical protein